MEMITCSKLPDVCAKKRTKIEDGQFVARLIGKQRIVVFRGKHCVGK